MSEFPKLKLKDGVKVNGAHFDPEVTDIIAALLKTAPPLEDDTVWITSAADGKHMPGSKHYIDRALDVRTRNIIGGHAVARQWVEVLSKELGPNYDIILESDHLHIEHDVHIIPTKEDYAWIAGFIDGDGSFSLRAYSTATRKMVQPVIQISQLHPASVSKIKNLIGGTINQEENRGKTYYRIVILGQKRLRNLINNILPYLANKKSLAILFDEILNLRELRTNKGYSEDIWNRFFEIKREIEKINRES